MQPLSELQKNWLEAVTMGRPAILRSVILPPPRDSIDVRIAIYADAYILRLIDSLAIIFPYFKKWVGEKKFDEIGRIYFKEHPPATYAIREVGESFPVFLAKHYDDKIYQELALLELAISTTVDIPDHNVITREDLQNIPQEEWGEVVFTLHPTLMLLSFYTNVIALYEALQRDQTITPEQNTSITFCRVWRKQLQVYYLTISTTEATFLQGLIAQFSFGEICEKLCEQLTEKEVVSFAINQLLRWLDEGLLTHATIRKTA
jgi:hypothetical protein